MTFIVTWTNPNTGDKFPLRGTVWAFAMDRAQKYETREAAKVALDKAKKFMDITVYRSAVIEEIPE